MKISEILGKSLDVVTENPHILVPYIVPVLLSVAAAWAGTRDMISWGIAPLYPLGRRPLTFFSSLVTFLRRADAVDLAIWIVILVVLAICVALTITMGDAALSGRSMKIGEAFDSINKKLPIFVVAFLVSWLLKFFGLLFFWVGIFIPSVLLIFVGQAILLDNKDLFDSFSKSYDMARKNWIEILVLLFAFLVVLIIVRLLPILGVIVACLLLGYSTLVFTVMYRDRSRAAPRPRRARPAPEAQPATPPQ